MILIGGNSRNCGKTTLACNIIGKLAKSHEVIGLKVTAMRPGEDHLHGNHDIENSSDFTIFEELDPLTHKDTSRMLQSGAKRVFYIQALDESIENRLLDFISKYSNKQPIVCESRSLRRLIKPSLFLMMIRVTEQGTIKHNMQSFLPLANKVFDLAKDENEMKQFVDSIQIFDGEIVSAD